MKKLITILMTVLMTFGIVAMTGCGGSTNITIYTGGTGGTYYAFTNGLQTQLAKKTDYTYSVVGDTGGSVANLKAIQSGDCKMAIVQNDTMVNAYNGFTQNFAETGAITNFSVIGQVYPEVIQIVTDDANIKTLADLKGSGKSVSIGDVGSGVEANAVALLRKYGIDIAFDEANKKYTSTDIVIQNLSVAKSADAMKENKLSVFFFTSGAPATSITEIALAKTVYMLGLSDAVMDEFIAENKIDNKYDVYSKQPITNAQYNFISASEPVWTIGVSATYIISNSLSEEIVYNITKAIWESKGSIGHSVESTMNTDYAFVTIGNVPVHPGAAKYYREIGLTVNNVAQI
ncbi:MAG: TAXI family TRAP transporter solute-binding subunit [Clostridiales bacterium]|nr:TAXI family TRAP transporter solute-binding subunit [Clostridiales bacterium]